MAQKPVDVTVDPGVGITVNTDKVRVEKNVDTVAWKSTKANQEFGIVLPAGQPTVSCGYQGNKWVCSAGPFSQGGTIKYDVTASATPTLDPDIEVFPAG